MKQKLTMAAAFYHNDKPTGVGVQLFAVADQDMQLALNDLLASQEKVLQRAEAQGNRDVYFSTLLEVIHELAPKKNALSSLEARVVFSAIYMLEKHKRIPSDEYNGCIFNYTTTQ